MITNENEYVQMNLKLCMSQCMRKCMNQCMSQYPSDSAGFIKVTNKAAYLGRFSIGYDYHGQFRSFDSPNLKPTKSYTIQLPSAATGILFLAQYYSTTSTIKTITRLQYPNIVSKCFNLTGTIFNPHCVETRC
ncbi:hypothetical protein IRP63_15810 (plasmid) [Clostridium botulinum]|uniref:Uncharacterized protein n=1 Tax=Clostridium botulinum C/D str. DC5 TaxID=1443128 RepID=A0A0A0HX75_CLOBO|nr:hypothetical protein [Clostridium botulinum]KEI00025.1 hypothetical protein Z952_14465 [Clostridium botulinum C/D str. BKT75002]KEI05809.1 hypothetical protein Z954_14620 [Clostridium botulinum C/D str. BKT2873]KGM92993.1 hypothetical protein Z955_16375 [Clostridium botulinum C/D str. DC5]KOC45936.1 hypothetical protein ADU88_12945 [Clostridium botulinum]KOC54610.1 hypothetical protein ADU90_12385 [Clostridium botulinum]